MNGKQINEVLKRSLKNPCDFKGVFTLNELEKVKKYALRNSFIIVFIPPVNNNENVGHWVSLYFNRYNRFSFFDSLGFEIEFYKNLYNIMNKHGYEKQQNYSNRLLQNPFNKYCGLYNCYFIFKKSQGFNYQYMFRLFSKNNHDYNDSLLVSLMKPVVH